MSMNMKYVVLDGHMCDEIYLFPNMIPHDEFVKNMVVKKDVISAGFVDEHLDCYGKSVSLGVEAREVIDTALLSRQFD